MCVCVIYTDEAADGVTQAGRSRFGDPWSHLLKSWVRIPPGAWIFVCCECRVLSGRGLCDELITRPEESYRLCCVVVCDLETSRMGAPYIYIYIYIYDISRLRVKLDQDRVQSQTFRNKIMNICVPGKGGKDVIY